MVYRWKKPGLARWLVGKLGLGGETARRDVIYETCEKLININTLYVLLSRRATAYIHYHEGRNKGSYSVQWFRLGDYR